MLYKKKFLCFQSYIILFYFIVKAYLIEINLKNDDESMETLASKINNIQTISDYDEIKILLNDNYYKIAANSQNNFILNTSLIFHSNNGTYFDFQKIFKTELLFHIQPTSKKIKIIFQNITFYNFFNINKKNTLFTFSLQSDSINYQIFFENCTFMDIPTKILYFQYSNREFLNEPQVILNNCKFM